MTFGKFFSKSWIVHSNSVGLAIVEGQKDDKRSNCFVNEVFEITSAMTVQL